jgi:hypothetical protein
MRFIITIVAVLMILGLAAFGVVSAQKISAAPSQSNRFRFARRAGIATRTSCGAASSSQSRQPSRSNRH